MYWWGRCLSIRSRDVGHTPDKRLAGDVVYADAEFDTKPRPDETRPFDSGGERDGRVAEILREGTGPAIVDLV